MSDQESGTFDGEENRQSADISAPDPVSSGRGTTGPEVLPCEFGASSPVSKEQLRVITLLSDLFARNLTHNLGVWLRTSFSVTLASVERPAFGDFLHQVPDHGTYLASLRIEPLDVISLLQMNLELVPPVVDLLLGGTGEAAPPREPTEIEEAILRSLVENIARELSASWESVGLETSFDRRQLYTQLGRLMPVNEKTLCLTLNIEMAAAHGKLQLVFPAVIANTLLRRLSSDWERQRRRAPEMRERLKQRLAHVSYGATLQLPVVKLSGSQLRDMAPGKVLRLNVAADVPAQFLVGGRTLFEAVPVRCGAHRAAHLSKRIADRTPHENKHEREGQTDV